MTMSASRAPFSKIVSRFLLAFCGRALACAALAALLPALLASLGCSSSKETPAGGDDAGPPPVTAAPFTLALGADKLPVLQGATATVDVVLTRQGDFAGPVTLAAVGLPTGATLVPAVIAAGQTTATLTVAADAAAPHALPSPVTIQGTAGADVASAPLTVTIYGPPGSLDTSFGGGKVVVPVGAGDDYAYAVAVDAMGRVLIAGRAAEGLGDFALVRLDRDGALDATFGIAGKVTTDFAGGADTAYGVAVQTDGKIVVAGTATVAGTGQDFAVARYLDSGALDPTFGGGTGKVTTAFGADSDTAYALLLQADGKIVLGGDGNQGSSTTGIDFTLARYGADGTLDATFGAGGKVITAVAPNGGRDSIYALALQTVAGLPLLVAAGGEGDFQLARYTMAGTLDPTFGTAAGSGKGTINGMLGTSIGAARAIQIAADGKILVAGHATTTSRWCASTPRAPPTPRSERAATPSPPSAPRTGTKSRRWPSPPTARSCWRAGRTKGPAAARTSCWAGMARTVCWTRRSAPPDWSPHRWRRECVRIRRAAWSCRPTPAFPPFVSSPPASRAPRTTTSSPRATGSERAMRYQPVPRQVRS